MINPKIEHYMPSIESFRDLLADAVLLSETNVDWKVRDNHYGTHLTNRDVFKPSPIKTTTASVIWENRDRSTYQSGGVMSLFTNYIAPRIVRSESDELGRWTKNTIQIKKKNIVIYNTYRSHPKTLDIAGRDTPWMQQWVAIRNKTGEDCDPRSIHIDDMIEDVQKVQEQGDLVLIIGDFNEDLDDPEENGIKKLQLQCNLIQAYEHIVGITPSSRSNSRHICHTFLSPNLIRYVRQIGVCSEHDGFVL